MIVSQLRRPPVGADDRRHPRKVLQSGLIRQGCGVPIRIRDGAKPVIHIIVEGEFIADRIKLLCQKEYRFTAQRFLLRVLQPAAIREVERVS